LTQSFHDRRVALHGHERPADRARLVQHADEDGRDVVARDVRASEVLADRDARRPPARRR
jgi:hypothetical protein